MSGFGLYVLVCLVTVAVGGGIWFEHNKEDLPRRIKKLPPEQQGPALLGVFALILVVAVVPGFLEWRVSQIQDHQQGTAPLGPSLRAPSPTVFDNEWQTTTP